MWSDIYSVAATRIGFLAWIWSTDTMDWGSKYLVDFNTGKSQMVSFDRSNNTDAIDGKMDESVFEEKSYFKMLGLASLLN